MSVSKPVPHEAVPHEGAALPDPARPVRTLDARAEPAWLAGGDSLGKYLSIRPYALGMVAVSLFLLGSISVWSAVAPLHRGAVAPGLISVESIRKTIQHLEGGIISEIHVVDGSRVSAGAALITLDGTAARASVQTLRNRLFLARAFEARLTAQRDGAEAITFPEELLAERGDPEVDRMLQAQETAFVSQRDTLTGRRGILDERIHQAELQIQGLQAQINSFTEQRRLIGLEQEDVQYLIDRGLERRARLLALQRTSAQLLGEIEANRAAIAQTQQRIAESRLQIIDLENSLRERTLEELRVNQERIAETVQQLRAAEDVLGRLVVRAPLDGIVVDLRFHTVGGVIRPGDPLLDLVPVDDDLIVLAQVEPQHIDVVYPGLRAEVILTALNQRTTPHLNGEVITVSADRLEDQRTGMPYYSAQVRIDRGELAALDRVQLHPGMPADVLLITGQRTLIEYLLQPLTETARRGLIAE